MSQRKLTPTGEELDLVKIYQTANEQDRARLFKAFNPKDKKRLSDLQSADYWANKKSLGDGLTELKKAIEDNLAVDSVERHAAIQFYKELCEYVKSTHYAPRTNITDEELKETLQRTIALVKTPYNHPEFAQRISAFTDTMDNIRSEGRWNVVKGLGLALAVAILVAGAALLTAATFGAFGIAFGIGASTLSAIGVASCAAGAITTGGWSGNYFFQAHEQLSYADSMQNAGAALSRKRL